jgi:hypothetical protein
MATHFSGPISSTNGFTAGGGTTVTYVQKGTVAADLASISTLDVGEITLTITGAVVGDAVIVNPVAAGLTTGLFIADARVSATDTVKVRVYNSTGGSVDEASQLWTYVLIRS